MSPYKTLLVVAAAAVMAPAAHAASCIATNRHLIITELADPATVPDGIDAAKARFIQLYVKSSFFCFVYFSFAIPAHAAVFALVLHGWRDAGAVSVHAFGCSCCTHMPFAFVEAKHSNELNPHTFPFQFYSSTLPPVT